MSKIVKVCLKISSHSSLGTLDRSWLFFNPCVPALDHLGAGS